MSKTLQKYVNPENSLLADPCGPFTLSRSCTFCWNVPNVQHVQKFQTCSKLLILEGPDKCTRPLRRGLNGRMGAIRVATARTTGSSQICKKHVPADVPQAYRSKWVAIASARKIFSFQSNASSGCDRWSTPTFPDLPSYPGLKKEVTNYKESNQDTSRNTSTVYARNPQETAKQHTITS